MMVTHWRAADQRCDHGWPDILGTDSNESLQDSQTASNIKGDHQSWLVPEESLDSMVASGCLPATLPAVD